PSGEKAMYELAWLTSLSATLQRMFPVSTSQRLRTCFTPSSQYETAIVFPSGDTANECIPFFFMFMLFFFSSLSFNSRSFVPVEVSHSVPPTANVLLSGVNARCV